VIVIVGCAFGLITFPDASSTTLGLIIQAFALALLPNLLKNFFEEAAWRGYLAPRVFSLGFNDFISHAIVGFIWGAWHIPYYLFYEDPAILQEFTTLNMAAYIPLAFVVMIAWAFVYGEIRLLTNSIWPVVLMHAVEDAFLFALILDHHIVIQPGMDWLISPMNGLICVAIFLVIGVGLRQWRKGKNKSLVTEPLGVKVY
jgi:membrane protease YdiL (CAAX protease family)